MGYADLVMEDGPVGYWRMNETSGTTAYDASPNKMHGTYTGSPTLAAAGPFRGDPTSKAVTFSGTAQYVSIPDSSSLLAANTFTVSAWFHFTTGAAWAGLFSKPHQNATNLFWGLRMDSAGNRLLLYSDFPNSGKSVSTTNTVNDGNWHHGCATWDGSTVTLYLDAVSQGTVADAGTVTSNTVSASIGAYDATGTGCFTGTACECAFYNKVLSATRIREHYIEGQYRSGVTY